MGVKMDADALRAFLEETFPAAVALGFDMKRVWMAKTD